MYSPSSTRLRVLSWVVTFLLPAAAWSLPGTACPISIPVWECFLLRAACISAVIGGLPAAIAGALLNTAALVGFSYLYQPEISTTSNELWAALLIAVALVVGLARQKWSAAEMVAGRLSTDLARLRDELESQRSDLKRFPRSQRAPFQQPGIAAAC